MPSQRGQAPYGVLKEKLRGASSSKDRPQFRQAARSEKSMVSPVSTSSMPTTPSVRPSAVSIESERRRPMSAFSTNRSTITSMSCL